MKKIGVVFLLIVLLSFSAVAVTVSLTSPSNGAVVTSANMQFKCKVDDVKDLAGLSFYHNMSGSFKFEAINGSEIIPGEDYTFSDTAPTNGTYEWNCLANFVNNTHVFATSNYTFTYNITNSAPYLMENISDKKWPMNINKKINLGDYFNDPDSDDLSYSHSFTTSGSHHIEVSFSGDDVMFKPEKDWTGEEKIKITATDGKYSVTSNEFKLEITGNESNATTNKAPVINSFTPSGDVSINSGGTQRFTITKSDLDGDSIVVNWYINNVMKPGEVTDIFLFTPDSPGVYNIRATASDGQSEDSQSWTLTVKSATNQTTGSCGDGNINPGEDCESCPEDVICPEGYECKEKRCAAVKKTPISNIIMISLIVLALIGVAIVILFFYKRSKEKEIFGTTKLEEKKEEKSKEEKKGILSRMKGKFGREKKGFVAGRLAQPKNILEKAKPKEIDIHPVKPQKEKTPNTGIIKKHLRKKTKTSEKPNLKNYIRACLVRKKQMRDIKQTLIGVGWDEDLVDEAFDEVLKEGY